jgi:ubiquitin carboxyl-terminal hydrolase 47
MHRGGAFGGHYFAYIKSFENGKWYNFNDSAVNEIPVAFIQRNCFGGKGSCNAYMLMYKKVATSD